MNRTAATTITLILAASAAATSACSTQADATACQPQLAPGTRSALILVIGTHAGAPAPALPGQSLDQVRSALAAGRPMHVIAVDGTPALVTLPKPRRLRTGNCAAFNRDLEQATNTIARAVTALTPDSDGNNLYAGLALAGDAARAAKARDAEVIVIDNGLSDTAPLDYSRAGMTSSDPAQAARYARDHQRLDLSGLHVTLTGLGYTAPPQAPLSPAERAQVTTLWKIIATAAGANVSINPAPRTGAGPITTRTVKTCPTATIDAFQPPAPGTTTRTVLDETRLRFDTDSDQPIDDAAAAAAVAPIGAWLAGDPTRTATVRGRTDSRGTEAHGLELSRRRAATIKALLIAQHPGRISPAQIATVAEGTHHPGFINDRRPDGTFDPIAGATNRAVVIDTTS